MPIRAPLFTGHLHMIALPARLAVVLAIALVMWTGSARAQFGGLFDPPRPPGNVPNQPPAYGQPAPAQAYPPSSQSNPQLLPPGPPTGPPPGRSGIQSEDLPPPLGIPSAASPQPAALPRPGAAPAPLPGPPAPPPAGQRQERAATPLTPATTPAAAVPPTEDVVTQPPPGRINNPTAVFSGLDKITGRITTFDAAIGETVQFGALQVTARACYSRPPTESPLTDAFIEVDEVTLQGEVRRIFTGWMFAASPGLHGVEHAIYDVWLIDCKGGAPSVADAQPAAAPPARSTGPAPPLRQPAPRRQFSPGSQGSLTPPGR